MSDDADRAQQVVEQHIRHAFDRRRMYAAARWDNDGQPANTSAAMADAYEWMVYFRMRETEPGLRQCMKQLVKFGSEVDS